MKNIISTILKFIIKVTNMYDCSRYIDFSRFIISNIDYKHILYFNLPQFENKNDKHKRHFLQMIEGCYWCCANLLVHFFMFGYMTFLVAIITFVHFVSGLIW